MSLGGRIAAAMYDGMIRKTELAGLQEQRRTLLASAAGNVLEIGGGTGANLAQYGTGVESLTITEPEPAMIKRLRRRIAATGASATVLRAPAEDLPFNDGSFDTVVSTLVLCAVDDQPRAIRELHRVLRPGGRFLFIEHVLADEPRLAKLQRRMNGINRLVVHCHCARSTLEEIRSAGFVVSDLERSELKKAPPFVRPLIIGMATPSPSRPTSVEVRTQPAQTT